MDNMSIYERYRSVPETAKKQFNNGSFSGTDINPMWRIKCLTEAFGACGVGWYYDEPITWLEKTDDGTVMAHCKVALYVKVDGEWSKPIWGIGGNALVKMTKSGARPSDEGYKMALTDALSVACKALGIGADVYFAKDKSSKYSQYYTEDQEQPASKFEKPETVDKITAEQVAEIRKLAAPDAIEAFEKKLGARLEDWSAGKAIACLKYLRGEDGKAS